MSVELQPPELGFKRPFTHEVSQVLRLHNPHGEPVAFKVKTTAPKQYCVRPNSGRIDPSSTVEVQVLLQAMKEDPPLDAKCRDKFLVQSVIVPSNAAPDANVTQIWQTVEATAKSSIQEKKIRVTFLPAEGQANGLAVPAHEEEQPPAYDSPGPAAVTPQRAPASEAKSPSLIDQSVASIQSAAETVSNTASSTVAAVASAVPTTQEDLNKKLEEANATIAQLRNQVADGLRQRKVTDSTTETKSIGDSKLAMQNQAAPGGVPVQVVAALCLLCFLLAYLFF